MGEAGMTDNDRCERHTQHNVFIAGIAAVWRRVSFCDPSEQLAMSPIVTTGSGTESAEPSEESY